MRHLTIAVFASLLILVAAAGCRYHQGGAEAQDPGPSIEGRWKGTWLSDFNGHTGELWAIITGQDDGSLLVKYRGTYGAGLTFQYEVPMTVERDGDILRFSAESDLGDMWGGVYTYEGSVEGDVFHSTYNSSVDHGTFNMTRLTGPIEPDDTD